MSAIKPIMNDAQKAKWRDLESAYERAASGPRHALAVFLEQFDCEPQECEACGGVFDLADCNMLGDDGWFCKNCITEIEGNGS
jgi:formamidopyrimidine-DNA glycosylase